MNIWTQRSLQAMLTCACGAAICIGGPSAQRPYDWALTILGLAVIAVGIVQRWNWHRETRVRLAADDFQLCPNCAYSLADLEWPSNSGVCPECGAQVDRSSAADAWRRSWVARNELTDRRGVDARSKSEKPAEH